MSNGTKVVLVDTVRGHGHKLAPWHGKRGTVVAGGRQPGTVWVQFGNASLLCHTDNMRVA